VLPDTFAIRPLERTTRWSRQQSIRILIVGLLAVAGCDQRPDAQMPESTSADVPLPMRVVSLAPAVTRMIVDLGVADVLVGVGEHDDAAPAGLRVVGNFMNIHTEALVNVRPTHVVAMYGSGAVPPQLVRLARTHQFELSVYAYPNRIDQVMRILYRDDDASGTDQTSTSRSLARLVGAPVAGRRLRDRMLAQLDSIADLTRTRPAPSVLMVIATGPVMASGPGTVLDDMLCRYAGARNAAAAAAMTVLTCDREKLLRLRPDVILLLRPGDPPLGRLEDDPRLADLRGLDIPAVQQRRIALISDPLTLLPATSLPRIVGAMVASIHRDLREPIDSILDSRTDATAHDRLEPVTDRAPAPTP